MLVVVVSSELEEVAGVLIGALVVVVVPRMLTEAAAPATIKTATITAAITAIILPFNFISH
jgi:ABC-type branched-subunit amino acid transport system permease subunit